MHIIAEPIQLRTIVGREVQRELVLVRKSESKGMFFLKSSYQWVKVTPNAFIPLKTDEIRVKASVTPPLAGPIDINLNACIIDPWGLSQVRFEINPLKLTVIPRARYADWLARRYLTGAKLGRLPLVSDVGEIKSLYGLRQGIEFYGNRMYQPGDNLASSRTTLPAVTFKPHAIKKPQIVPYDADRAVELMMRRDPLPPVFKSISDVTEIPEGMVGRNKLVIKHKRVEDMMRYTRCDEG